MGLGFLEVFLWLPHWNVLLVLSTVFFYYFHTSSYSLLIFLVPHAPTL